MMTYLNTYIKHCELSIYMSKLKIKNEFEFEVSGIFLKKLYLQ